MIKNFLEKHPGRKAFLEHEVKRFLREAGLPVPNGLFVDKPEKMTPHELAYPLVAKVASSRIVSKSDVQGVRAGIKDEHELKRLVKELIGIENAEGVLVEEMAPRGLEVIIGGVVDKQFGPVIMFGLGGVFVELFKDVAFGLAPMTREDALTLIREVKGYRLIEGYRGNPPADKEALLDIIIRISEIMATGLLEEIDLNPVALYPKGAMILDAKMKAIAV
jgi:acetyl-CoA synthetase (ADP-forming)